MGPPGGLWGGGEGKIVTAVSTAYPRHTDGISPPARSDFSGGMRVGAHLCVLVRTHKRAARIAEMCVPYWKMSDFLFALLGSVGPVGFAGWFAS